MSNNEMQAQEFHCLGLSDELPDHSAIQELENLVDEAHLNTESNDISKIIQYHDSDVRLLQIFTCNLDKYYY